MADDQGRRSEWIAAWGVVTTVAATVALVDWGLALPKDSTVPIWPAFVFGVIALVGFYMTFAPVFHWRPFRREPTMDDLLRREWRMFKRRRKRREFIRIEDEQLRRQAAEASEI